MEHFPSRPDDNSQVITMMIRQRTSTQSRTHQRRSYKEVNGHISRDLVLKTFIEDESVNYIIWEKLRLFVTSDKSDLYLSVMCFSCYVDLNVL